MISAESNIRIGAALAETAMDVVRNTHGSDPADAITVMEMAISVVLIHCVRSDVSDKVTVDMLAAHVRDLLPVVRELIR